MSDSSGRPSFRSLSDLISGLKKLITPTPDLLAERHAPRLRDLVADLARVHHVGFDEVHGFQKLVVIAIRTAWTHDQRTPVMLELAEKPELVSIRSSFLE